MLGAKMRPLMQEVREAADRLEALVDDEHWPHLRAAGVPRVEDYHVYGDREHRIAQAAEEAAQRAPARERLEHRQRQEVLQYRIANPDQEQRHGDVGHQHVLRHVSRHGSDRPDVERREERTEQARVASPPVRLLSQRDSVAAAPQHPHRARVEERQQREHDRGTQLERHPG